MPHAPPLRLALLLLATACGGTAPLSGDGAPSARDGAPLAADGSSPADAALTPDAAPTGWRSALYPASWTPAFTDDAGHFLHDFSYAGYRAGEAEPGAPADAALFDVVAAFGADPTGTVDATTAVQAAIAAASASAPGGVVYLPAGRYRITGRLDITTSHVVLRGAGTTVSRLHLDRVVTAADTLLDYSAHIRFRGSLAANLEFPLTADGASRDTALLVADAGELVPGDDVTVGWNISAAFIADHGMTGIWSAFNGTWQPIFWRTIVAIDRSTTPHRITLDVPLRYPALVRDGASVRRLGGWLREVGLEELGLANASDWAAAWRGRQVHLVELVGVTDGWIRGVSSFVSPTAPPSGPGSGHHLQSSGLLIDHSRRVTVSNTHLAHAQHRGGGGNGYLFEMRQSGEILFRDSTAVAGRHNFIQNWGFGSTGCVWLRVESRDGESWPSMSGFLASTGYSEFHHSLATANLIDSSRFADGLSIVNRGTESTGAGHTGTENAFWNVDGLGRGTLRSLQFAQGYVIGAHDFSRVVTSSDTFIVGAGTAPDDWVEGTDALLPLEPASLYEDQLRRRLGR